MKALFRHMVAYSMAVPAVLAVSLWSPPVYAQEHVYNFSIPSQDLKTSLHAFSKISKQQILFEGRSVRGKKAPALIGAYTVRAGIQKLLSGSGLEAHWGKSGVIIIRPIARRASPQRPQTTPNTRPKSSGLATQRASQYPLEDELPQRDIIVTGTRIPKQVSTESAAAVVRINRTDIEESGATELSEILADYPAVTQGLNLANSNTQINAAGVSSVSLRGLGTDRTLTLIDGKRTVSNRITANSVSLSSIPTLFVERVEIITGGASAVYGSDAIAGVINIITRKNFDGLSIKGRTGLSDNHDAQRYNLDALYGSKFVDDRVTFLAGASYEKDAGVMGYQRNRALQSLSYSQAEDANPLNQGLLGITSPSLSSHPVGGRFSVPAMPGAYFYYASDGQLGKSNDIAVYGHDTRPDLQYSTPRTSYLGAAKVTAELGRDLEMFGHIQYAKIKTNTARGGADTASNLTSYGQAGALAVGTIAPSNPFVPDEIESLANGSAIQWNRRFNEVGRYAIRNDRQSWRAWAGLRGKIGENWNWEASYGYGRFRQIQNRVNLLNLQNLNYALQAEYDPAHPGDLNSVRCINAQARENGCVPINIFGAGSISDAGADYIRTTMHLDGLIKQNILQAYMNGEIEALPAGAISVALGVEYRKDWQRSLTDDVTRQGLGSASFIAEYTGAIKAKEIFGEIDIPLLHDLPMAQNLSVNAAARLGSYNIKNVDHIFSYRFGTEWRPVAGLRFRAQYSRAQRAPTVTNLYSPLRDDADNVVDLCNGVTAASSGTIANNCRSIPAIASAIAANGVFSQATTAIEGPSSGNPDLREETADTLTAGLVFTPQAIPNFSMTVDYFKIKVRDAINALNASELLRECLGNIYGITENFFCDAVTRDASGQITRIVNRDLNLNKIGHSGLDIGMDYRFDAPRWLHDSGQFDLRLLYSRNLGFYTEFDGVNGPSFTQRKGEIGAWKNTGQFQLGYKEAGLSLRWKARYIGKAVDSNERLAIAQASGSSPPFLHVGDRVRHDFYASFVIPNYAQRLQLYTGINNAFNSISPFLPSGTVSGSSRNVSGDYDIMGRYFYAGFNAKF